jgi:hypothetical protein
MGTRLSKGLIVNATGQLTLKSDVSWRPRLKA